MKSMASAQEWIQAPPPGRYNIEITSAEAGFSQKGESHIKISGKVADGQFANAVFFHNIGTDGGTKYGGMGKKHLRALGVPVDSDLEIPDAVIAQKLIGFRLQAECGNEQREKPIVGADGKNTGDTVKQVELDPKTQKAVPIMNLTVIGYITQPGFRLDLGLPQQAQPGMPQGQPQFAPQGQPQYVPQGAPQQFAPQGAPTYVPQGQPQFSAPNPGYVPTQAQPVWNGQPNGALPGGVPSQAPTGLPPGVQTAPR